MKTAVITLASATLLALPLSAERLHPERLPADVAWVVHLDVERLLQSRLWGLFMEHREDLHIDMEGVDEVREQFGVDLLRDVRSVTLFGRSDEHEAVAMVLTNRNVDQALQRLREQPGYLTVEHEGIRLHSWAGDDDRILAYIEEQGDDRLVLVSEDLSELVGGIMAVRGERESLAPNGGKLASRPADGSIFYVAAAEGLPGLDRIEPASAIAGLVRGIKLDVGEAGGVLRANASVTTAQSEDANELSSIIQGGIALARMASRHADAPPPVSNILAGLSTSRSGNEISATFQYDVEQLFAEMQALSGSEW